MYPFRHIIESLWFKKLCMCPFIIGTKDGLEWVSTNYI